MPRSERQINQIGGNWIFHVWNECTGQDRRLRYQAKESYALWLLQFKSDSRALSVLRNMVRGIHGSNFQRGFDDDQFLRYLAGLLSIGRVHAHLVLRPIEAMAVDPVSRTPPVPRWSKLHPKIAAPPPEIVSPAEANSFSPLVDLAATAENLQRAAQLGVPFCEECAKAAARARAAASAVEAAP